MYILPTLTYLEVGAPAAASNFFIFEPFKWEPIFGTPTEGVATSFYGNRAHRDRPVAATFCQRLPTQIAAR